MCAGVPRCHVTTRPSTRALRPAWKVAILAFVITLAIGTAVGLAAAIVSGSIDRDPHRAGVLYGRAFAPFILIVTIAAYVIQRARLTRR